MIAAQDELHEMSGYGLGESGIGPLGMAHVVCLGLTFHEGRECGYKRIDALAHRSFEFVSAVLHQEHKASRTQHERYNAQRNHDGKEHLQWLGSVLIRVLSNLGMTHSQPSSNP